jgi:hypothetical protein
MSFDHVRHMPSGTLEPSLPSTFYSKGSITNVCGSLHATAAAQHLLDTIQASYAASDMRTSRGDASWRWLPMLTVHGPPTQAILHAATTSPPYPL